MALNLWLSTFDLKIGVPATVSAPEIVQEPVPETHLLLTSNI